MGASLYVLVLALHEEGPCIGLEAQLPANPLGLVRELLRLVRFDVVAGVEDAVTAGVGRREAPGGFGRETIMISLALQSLR